MSKHSTVHCLAQSAQNRILALVANNFWGTCNPTPLPWCTKGM